MTAIFRPNTAKFFFVTVLKTLIFLVIAIIIMILLEFSENSPGNILNQGIIYIIIFAGIVILYSYLSIISEKYTFFNEKMTYTRTNKLLLSFSKTVSYSNISNANHKNKELFYGLYKIGEVVLDLSSLGEKALVMRYVDDEEKVSKQINQILRNFHVKTHTEFTEKHKIKEILDKGGL